jgi:hypothetical protein
MAKDDGAGNSGKQGGSGSGRPQPYITGTVQKDAHGGKRPKPYGTTKVQEGENRKD